MLESTDVVTSSDGFSYVVVCCKVGFFFKERNISERGIMLVVTFKQCKNNRNPGSLPGVKRSGREVDQPPPSSAEINPLKTKRICFI
jgi:hypothetical protein